MTDSNITINISRPILQESDLDKYKKTVTKFNLKGKLQLKVNKLKSMKPVKYLQFFEYYIPFIYWIRTYQWKSNLKFDVFSGLTVGVMQISQGLAYGALAGLEPISGIYVSFVPGLIFQLFTSSNFVHLGTFAIVSLLVSTVMNSDIPVLYAKSHLIKINSTHTTNMTLMEAKYVVSATLTLLVGLIQLLLFFFNGGLIAKLLSPTVISAFIYAAACHVFTSQFPSLLGLSIPNGAINGTVGTFVKRYMYIFSNIKRANTATIVVAVLALAFLIASRFINDIVRKRFNLPFPGDFIAIIIATGVSYGAKLNQRFNISIVGYVPTGLPSVVLPDFSLIPKLISSAVMIALITFAIDVSIGSQLAKLKGTSRIRPNQELLALGVSNTFSSFFKCYVAGSSLARSIVHANIGFTQMFSIVSAIFILIVMLVAAKLFNDLPKAILSAVIIVALIPVFKKIVELKVYWKNSKKELAIWCLTCLSTIFIGIDYGLAVGVAVCLIIFIFTNIKAKVCEIGKFKNYELFRETDHFMNLQNQKMIKFVSFPAAIFYLNSETFESEITCMISEMGNLTVSDSTQEDIVMNNYSKVAISATSYTPCLIIDMSKVPYIDYSGEICLTSVIQYAHLNNVNILFSCCSDCVRNSIVTSNDDTKVFVSNIDAYEFALKYFLNPACHKASISES